jgi:1-pyrroline-5-carboxylate dehydrogenase
MFISFISFLNKILCRFNAFFTQHLYDFRPLNVDSSIKNSMRHRGLEGFVAAISPFNFTAIGGNLAYAPALMVSNF